MKEAAATITVEVHEEDVSIGSIRRKEERRWWWSRVLLGGLVCAVAYLIGHNAQTTASFDYISYIQQARTVWRGERDYSRVKGDTGPLVYPAGHLLVYTIIDWLVYDPVYFVSLQGIESLFTALHLISVLVASRLYQLASLRSIPWSIDEVKGSKGELKAPFTRQKSDESSGVNWLLWLQLGFLLSLRLHNTFVIGFYNDCCVTPVVLSSILFIAMDRWAIGCFLFRYFFPHFTEDQ
eukprot:TRINITY_DN605_c0_g1_i3.p1 TRINITY_DN605_c0_g1~~TRINITY_DN605_c0_g1_i3.p1  ORF type:complete len:237 (-),score=32.90 TRINITY_DN605_c0_g1_i3:747-1457(-)